MDKITTFDFHPELDVSHLQTMYGQNWAFAEDMFRTFLNEILPSFYKLTNFVKTENWDAYYKIVHRVQPGMQMVGLSKLQQKVHTAETIVKTKPASEPLMELTTEILEELDHYVVVLKKQVQIFQDKMVQQ